MNKNNMPIEFADGMFYNEPHENAPDFVLASISIRPDNFVDWIKKQPTNEQGFVRLSVKRGKNGKPYVSLDTWVKGQQRGTGEATESATEDTISADDIPFN